jgi:SAM-dependent methyltransferase
MAIEFGWLPGALVQPELAEQCAELYSRHYGNWSEKSPINPGKRIRLSRRHIQQWLEKGSLWYATQESNLIGYAIAQQAPLPRRGKVSWVTQLVVHSDYRQIAIAKRLLFSIWNFSDHFAWGLISANPYAVRALEKATRRRCNPYSIQKYRELLENYAHSNIHYLGTNRKPEVDATRSVINSEFFVNHTSLNEKLQQATTPEKPWLLGGIDEGWEWFAFTFNEQPQISLSPAEIEAMLRASDDVTKQAYSRMTLDKQHKWAQSASNETKFVIELCDLKPGTKVLDIGCGNGRHVIEFGKAGISCCGVDYVERFINAARNEAKQSNLSNVVFQAGDARLIDLNQRFDAVVCLYDVVGSYTEDKDNQALLAAIARHLKPRGYAIITVMNYALTEQLATQTFSLKDEPNKLLTLKPSSTMETTGNIFDPQFFMVETNTRVVYRREQFTVGESLPTELIVRDRRFTQEEIIGMCKQAGLDVQLCRFVRAGQWQNELLELDTNAKEIFLLCRLAVQPKKPEPEYPLFTHLSSTPDAK